MTNFDAPVRTVDLLLAGETEKYREKTFCQAPGCFRYTKSQKPYCIDHIELSEYPMQVRAGLDKRDKERAKLSKGVWPGDNSTLVRDAIDSIKESKKGYLFAFVISQVLEIEFYDALTLLRKMSDRNLIRTGKTRRGAVYARLR